MPVVVDQTRANSKYIHYCINIYKVGFNYWMILGTTDEWTNAIVVRVAAKWPMFINA